MRVWSQERVRTYMLRLEHGEDLSEQISRFVVERNIRCGSLWAIGALTSARLGFYDDSARVYDEIAAEETVEITNLIGNISERDGKPFVHAHITVSKANGEALGGHLLPGCMVFACEVVIVEYEGEVPVRAADETTGLFLWKKDTE